MTRGWSSRPAGWCAWCPVEPSNLKVTTAADLRFAELLLTERA